MYYIAKTIIVLKKKKKKKLIQSKQGTQTCYETKYSQPQL